MKKSIVFIALLFNLPIICMEGATGVGPSKIKNIQQKSEGNPPSTLAETLGEQAVVEGLDDLPQAPPERVAMEQESNGKKFLRRNGWKPKGEVHRGAGQDFFCTLCCVLCCMITCNCCCGTNGSFNINC